MAKNVLIFCDGTGQVGGLHFDEVRTNVYKMFRAMRCGPDSTIDPAHQVAFYDPGIGSSADGGGLVGGVVRRIYNLVAQATGFGITRNVVDCYAAAIRLWEPGDRIYLFGFSRGAYTARCVAEVLALCGIPRETKNGRPLALDQASVRKIARHAVKHVYQFTAPRPPGAAKGKQAVLEATRLRLAATFRSDHAARHDANDGTYPHFVGVFDTVAALVNPTLAAGLGIASTGVAVVLAFISSLLFSAFGDRLATFGWSLAIIAAVAVAATGAAYVYEHFKVDYEGGRAGWRDTWHFTDPYPTVYDENLDPDIAYAKHAISIDENRKSFARVKWGHEGRNPARDPEGRLWFEQVRFAGNHADIGGGYTENESRLSDITLGWMLDCACEVPGDLRFDPSVLRRWPSATGPQHDQVAAGLGLLTKVFKVTWPQLARLRPKGGVILHHTVYDRFEADAVPYWNGPHRYLPETLAGYPDVAAFYAQNAAGGLKANRASLASNPKSARDASAEMEADHPAGVTHAGTDGKVG